MGSLSTNKAETPAVRSSALLGSSPSQAPCLRASICPSVNYVSHTVAQLPGSLPDGDPGGTDCPALSPHQGLL